MSSRFFEIGSQAQTSRNEAALVQKDPDSHHFELLRPGRFRKRRNLRPISVLFTALLLPSLRFIFTLIRRDGRVSARSTSNRRNCSSWGTRAAAET